MNRTILEVATFETQSSDLGYWLTRPPAERLEALELLRQIHYGELVTNGRLVRVLEVIQPEERSGLYMAGASTSRLV